MPSDLEYPKGLDDKDAILLYANTALRSARSYRIEIERAAQRNVLYYLGVQWIKYDQHIRFWRPIAVGKKTPRPVTNRVASLVNQSVANILNFKPPITYSPASDKPEDIAAATVADRINAIIEREASIDDLKALAARWLTLTGNVFFINNYDTSPEAGTDFVQAEQCGACGAVNMPLQIEQAGNRCPQCSAVGQFAPATAPQPIEPPTGTEPAPEQPPLPDGMTNVSGKVGVEYPKGRFKTELENVFTCYFDNSSGATIYDSPYFLNIRHRNKDWVARMYGEDVANRVSYNQPTEPYSGLFEALAYSTTLWSYGYGAPNMLSEPRTRVIRLWMKPRKPQAPDGIYAEIVDQEVVAVKPWQYKDEQGKPMLNVVHVGYDEVPGRVFYKSRIDDIIPKQDQRNRAESMLELHSIRMANAVWLVPNGIGLSKVTGEQGQVIRYNALANVPPPTRVTGDTVSPYIPQWITQLDKEMDMLMGLYDVGRGEAPGRGVTSYSAISLLDERSQQGQSGIMRNWSRGWMEWSRQNLNIWRQWATDDRYLTTGSGQWSIQKFNKAALTGGVNITAEVGSFKPQTMIAKRALFEQLIRLQIINPMDPMQKYELATALGATDMMPDFKSDMELASRRVDQLVQGGTPPPPQPWENHALAISVFRRFMQSEQFEGLPPMLQERIKWYGALHFQFMQQFAAPTMPGSNAPKPPQPGQPATGAGVGGPNQKGVAETSGPNLGTEQGQVSRERQLPTHPQMAGRG